MLNLSKYNFSFLLTGFEIVKSLKEGAIKNGGATKFEDKIISNIPASDFIEIEDTNTISIFVPSTMNTSKKITNEKYVNEVINMLNNKYNLNDLVFYNTKGSWYSEDNKEVIIEKITIVTLNLKRVIIDDDIEYFVNIAKYIKDEMSQESVSISINNSLCIV